MSLSNEQKKRYRTIGHALSPAVTVAGNGLSESVLAEIERALTDHELIKIKLAIAERDDRKQAIETLCARTHAVVVQEIGKVALIFRAAKKPNPKLSNLLR
jgi:RNA-binding protein